MSSNIFPDTCGGGPARAEIIPPPPVNRDPPSNVVALAGRNITWNLAHVRVAMTEKRIRIGCTEVSVEAAREIMDLHSRRFGKPVEENWQEIQ